jgi:hypothetical protein
MNVLTSGVKYFAVLCLILISVTVYADPPHRPDLTTNGNMWRVSAFLDATPGHAFIGQQDICFFPAGVVGTHQRYVWVSLAFPNWNGRATQEGDQIFMHGDFIIPTPAAKIDGHDSSQWELVGFDDKAFGAGHWKFWAEFGVFGTTLAYTNVSLNRIGKCDFNSAKDALLYNQSLPYPTDANGNMQSAPMGIDTSPLY